MAYLDLLREVTELKAENEWLRAENDTFSQQNRAWIRENTRLEARIAALEEALRAYVHGQYARGQELARAALARPTPMPDQRQYGKKCAHDGYVVAGCRDCEARAPDAGRRSGVMSEINWAEFDHWPPAEVECHCGARFYSHSKFVGALRKHILRVPCPKCGRNDNPRRISHPPEQWNIPTPGEGERR